MASTTPDPIDSLNLTALTIDKEHVNTENQKEKASSAKNDKTISSNVSSSSSTIHSSKGAPHNLESLETTGDNTASYPPDIYTPQAHAFYYGAYENAGGEWEEYPQFLNIESMDLGSTGLYNENPSMMFHTGYGYSSQMPYGPYSPVTTPLPSVSAEGQVYTSQQFPFPGAYYQQPAPPSVPYITSPTPMSQADLTVSIDRPDWMKSVDGTGSWTPLSSPAASPQPFGGLAPFGQGMTALASGMATQQQRPFYGFGSSVNSYDRGYSHGPMYLQGNNFGAYFPNLETSGRSSLAFDKGRRRGKGSSTLCSCNGTLDFLNEQSRGPRATRPKNVLTEQNSSVISKRESSTPAANRELYNRPDFPTEYKDAKFFIIKSYSEDNVHKSIKYGVWASTANGNKKLDAAYHEAKGQDEPCPVFLFFSVNASAQFCGVAEMIGPVNFEKSVDYWQQDKWTGQFTVKWHIIKDVPNSIFRHIILENNDNKPVTNSRDTQEVALEQGIEMLKLFKSHESDMSILDDFDFYEERQKAIQEKRARQQKQNHHQPSTMGVLPAGAGSESRNVTASPISVGFIDQMPKTFAEAVRLEESSPKHASADKKSFLASPKT